MKSIIGQLHKLFQAALVQVLGDEGKNVDPLIRPAGDEKFGDYQSNLAMSLAKQLKQKPREVAQQIVEALPAAAADMCEPFEIAGPGFINIRLKTSQLTDMLNQIPPAEKQDRLNIEPADHQQTVVIDYSGPNIAKQMHVGHLRSTVIGDSIARTLEFEGHKVIRQNHIGDWGTQFGMLCAHLKEKMPDALKNPEDVHLADLEEFYKEANARDSEDSEFHERARAEVVALHKHKTSTLRAWEYIVNQSRNHYLPLFRRLGVSLKLEDECGESFYAEHLPGVVKELKRQFGPSKGKGKKAKANVPQITVVEDQGALCVFHNSPDGKPMFLNPEGEPLPMIIRKSDGAFLYATTDLAALQFRINQLEADRIIYVTDARQSQHFDMLFNTVRCAGWTQPADKPNQVQLEHVTFGSILGEDRRPFKAREGENIKLADLLDEAVGRAQELIRANEADPEKKRGFNETEIKDIAEAVGIGAVKYADLSQNRQSDYIFSWTKMLAMQGNTAPYMMYAYARIRSIYRKGAQESGELTDGKIVLAEPAERALGRQILRFAETIDSVAQTLKINLLTDYLYELAVIFMRFYETCPVLKADTDQQRASRLRLCDLTARTLQIGLDLLGIRVVERM
ncbi:MAG: arginine--tRNA ligase [Planctomycetota bacterium]|jgi:arginyl-tRNA synthetase